MKATLYIYNEETKTENFAGIVDVDDAEATAKQYAKQNNAPVVGYREDDGDRQFPIWVYPPSEDDAQS